MILDRLEDSIRYAGLGAGFTRAFQFLKTLDQSRPDGRCEIEGDTVYATLMSYETKPPGNATHEVHRLYADVHLMLQGQEGMYFTPPDRLGAGSGYHTEKDYEMCEASRASTTLLVQCGQFVIFFPGEGHKPGLALGIPAAPTRKVVVKVRI